MKKQFLFVLLLGLLCSVGNSWAENAEWADLTKSTSLTVGQITLSGGSFSNSSYQVNGGNSLTIAASSGYVISGAVLTFSADDDNRTGGSKNGSPSVSNGYSYSYNSSNKKGTISLTGSSLQTITFTCVSGKAARIVAATVSYSTSGGGGGGEPAETYAITYDESIDNGSITGVSSSAAGETITVTATPSSGYMLDGLQIYNSSDEDVTAECSANENTFIMPAYAVKVSATFVLNVVSTVTSKFWNFDETFSSGGSVSGGTIKDKLEFLGSSNVTVSSSSKTFNGLSISKCLSMKKYSDGAHTIHIKVAGYSKISVYCTGGGGRTLSVTHGSVGGESLINEATTSSATIFSGKYVGASDADIYITNSGGSNGLNIYAVKVEPLVHGTIGATGWTTFASSSKLDLSTISGGTAYFAASISGNDVTLTSTDEIVEAGEGLMIKGTPDAVFAIETTTAAATFSDNNLLTGCITEANVDVNPDKYVLVNVGGEPKFQSLAEHGATIPAGKAYLDLTGGSPAPGLLRIVEGENNATAIEEFKANEDVVKFIENGRILILRDGITYDALGRIVK